ncbi:MAG: hypothetical protein H0U81_05695 [Pyrinomonadaceae bacterium]|nr:hypothetical protein [Pyrinomonadaceae bacterium]
MTNRRTTILTITAVALISLFLPGIASAQNGPWWGQGRDRNRDNDVYRERNRNRDYGRNRDDYGYDNRSLRDAVHRVEDRSEDFEDHLDSALDRSRYDDSRREDRINEVVKEFRDSSRRLKSRFNNGRDLNRSADEARRLLQISSRIDQFMSRNRLDSRTMSDWSQIRSDLRVIANAYGISTRDYDYNRGRGSYDPYGGSQRQNNNDWWRRLPLP